MGDGSIRATALCLIRRGDEILVSEGYDHVKKERFFRLLGGGIEFGELGEDAARRELREEIGADAEVVGYLGTVENIFVYEGSPGHEIVRIYECELADPRLYEQDEWEAHELDRPRGVYRLSWRSPAEFRGGAERLYPDELLPLIEGV